MPENTGFFVAAYVACAVVLGGYAVSLWRRSQAVRERLLKSAESKRAR